MLHKCHLRSVVIPDSQSQIHLFRSASFTAPLVMGWGRLCKTVMGCISSQIITWAIISAVTCANFSHALISRMPSLRKEKKCVTFDLFFTSKEVLQRNQFKSGFYKRKTLFFKLDNFHLYLTFVSENHSETTSISKLCLLDTFSLSLAKNSIIFQTIQISDNGRKSIKEIATVMVLRQWFILQGNVNQRIDFCFVRKSLCISFYVFDFFFLLFLRLQLFIYLFHGFG